MQNELGEEIMENVVDEVLRFEEEQTQSGNQPQANPADKVQVVQNQQSAEPSPTLIPPVATTETPEPSTPAVNEQVNPRIPIGRAAEMVGVSIDTLRRWDRSGKVMSRRSPGGHRYFLLSDLEEVFGTKYERNGTEIPTNNPVEISSSNIKDIKVETDRPNYVTEVVEEETTQTQMTAPITDSPSFVNKNEEIKIKNILEPMSETETPAAANSKSVTVLERAGIVGIVLFAIVDAILALLYFTGGNLISPLN